MQVRSALRPRIEKSEHVFSSLTGSHQQPNPTWAKQSRTDIFKLAYSGDIDTDILLNSMSKCLTRYLNKEISNLIAKPTDRHSFSISEYGPANEAIAFVALSSSKPKTKNAQNASQTIAVEIAAKGSKKVNQEIYGVINEILSSMIKMSSSELEHLVKKEEMISLFR